MALKLPNQVSIDRSVPLSSYMLTIVITDNHGDVIQKLNNPIGGPYGAVPSDPAYFPDGVNTRVAVCQVLTANAAMRCLRFGGNF